MGAVGQNKKYVYLQDRPFETKLFVGNLVDSCSFSLFSIYPTFLCQQYLPLPLEILKSTLLSALPYFHVFDLGEHHANWDDQTLAFS